MYNSGGVDKKVNGLQNHRMSWQIEIDKLPWLLAGPIVRKVTYDSASVWFVLKENREAELNIYLNHSADIKNSWACSGKSKGIQIGEHVFVNCLTVYRKGSFQPGKNYYYDIDFGKKPDDKQNGKTDSDDQNTKNDLLSELTKLKVIDITYGTDKMPSFAIPPDHLDELNIVHGSCRKPHGEEYDAMEGIHNMIESALEGKNSLDAKKRPHQFFLTGDQIYADDVADIMLLLIDDAAEKLFGWDEDKYANAFGKEFLLPGKRSDLVQKIIGFTSSIDKFGNKPDISKSHLLKFREFATMYMFAWSDILWPKKEDVIHVSSLLIENYQYKYPIENRGEYGSPQTPSFLNDELKHIQQFILTIKNIRKAMANVPVYMMFDDHDVTDDWNLNWKWCKNVYSKELGIASVRNAMAAMTLFQAWGNTPEEFNSYWSMFPSSTESKYIYDKEEKSNGYKLLSSIEKWAKLSLELKKEKEAGKEQEGTSNNEKEKELKTSLKDIETLLKINPIPENEIPTNNFSLKFFIPWHYSLCFHSYNIIVLDTRTFRDFENEENDDAARPGLISKAGFKIQLPEKTIPYQKVNIVISPAPVIGVPFVENIQETFAGIVDYAYEKTRITEKDRMKLATDAEAWGFNKEALNRLFASLSRSINNSNKAPEKAKNFILLSGDVHYGFTAKHQIWEINHLFENTGKKDNNCIFVQLNSSSFKNQNIEDIASTIRMHEKGYSVILHQSKILPELYEYGWNGVSDFFSNDIIVEILYNNKQPDVYKRRGKTRLNLVNSSEIKKLAASLTLSDVSADNTNTGSAGSAGSAGVYSNLDKIKILSPDWCTRTKFIAGKNDTETFIFYKDFPKNPYDTSVNWGIYIRYADFFEVLKNAPENGHGKQIVGKNNIGHISFEKTDSEKDFKVIHRLYWRMLKQKKDAIDTMPLFPITMYKVSLNFKDEKMPELIIKNNL